jgi:nitrogen fixation protein NifU and related proteins
MELDNLYQEVILDHYKHPLNKGLSDSYDVQVHHINPSCGDEITLNLSVEGSKIKSITWDGVGCSISQASVSIASDLLVDKDMDEADAITEQFIDLMHSKGTKEGDPEVLEDAVAMAGVSKFPARIKCALLGWMAYRDAADRIKQSGSAGDHRGSGQ